MQRSPLRHIVLDTETTGLSPIRERIVEIACVELENFTPTGREFQSFINPRQPVSLEAFQVHGLSADFLKSFPCFHEVVEPLKEFIGDSPLVIHNAPFDIGFLKAEFQRLNLEFTPNHVIDTLDLARKKFPGAPASLDALCKRFNVSLEKREKHNALLDCQLLAAVYLYLLGGPHRALEFQEQIAEKQESFEKVNFPSRSFSPSEKEQENHKKMIKSLKESPWNS